MSEREDVESKEIGKQLLAATAEVFEKCGKVRDGTIRHYHLRKLLEPIKVKVRELLEKGRDCENAKTSGICKNLMKCFRSLWTFVRAAEVEPTNNRAERALRRAVMWRRKSFGTQSESGSRFVERILTVVTTLRQQGRGVLDYLNKACAVSVVEHDVS